MCFGRFPLLRPNRSICTHTHTQHEKGLKNNEHRLNQVWFSKLSWFIFGFCPTDFGRIPTCWGIDRRCARSTLWQVVRIARPNCWRVQKSGQHHPKSVIPRPFNFHLATWVKIEDQAIHKCWWNSSHLQPSCPWVPFFEGRATQKAMQMEILTECGDVWQ